MSYCRHSFYRSGDEEDKSQSDVYMYEHVDDFIECCGCILSPLPNSDEGNVSIQFVSKRAALAHLWQHRLAGHIVPQYAFDRLEDEISEEEWEESKRRNKEWHEEIAMMKDPPYTLEKDDDGVVYITIDSSFKNIHEAEKAAKALANEITGKILLGNL